MMNMQSTEPTEPTERALTTGMVDAVIRSRKTIRAFRPDAVSKRLVAEILQLAGTAPSNSNTQPWKVHVLTGEPKRALGQAVLQAYEGNQVPPFAHFPDPLPDACMRRQGDYALRYYRALGIDRDDIAARARQTGRNFLFFDAPVGLIFTIDARLKKHSWLDYGLFVQTLMLAATARGLASCPQVSFARYQPVIAEYLDLPANEIVVCGMSLGYADERAAVNQLNMPREPAEAFTHWLGFED